MIEFSPHMIFGHDEHTQWPRDSQQRDERFFDSVNDDRNKGVWSSINWLSDEQIDLFVGRLLQMIFEQSIRSLAKTEKSINKFFSI